MAVTIEGPESTVSPADAAILLRPLQIGARSMPSRVVFGAHETNLGARRAISARHVAYYERRAAGGAGMIVVEDASVHPSDWPYERAPLAVDCGDGWSDVVRAVHPYGALVIAGLGHAGGQGTSHWSQRELWAPSPVPEVNTREVPKVMEDADIEAVIAGFAQAAGIAKRSGCDGVEVNAGQFSLVRQFLSGLTNQRGDRWADRLAFAREVLIGVRAAVGNDMVVGLRLSCDELAPWAGITPESAVDIAVQLAEHVDYLTVVRGSIYSVGATRPDGHTPAGFNLDLIRSISSAVRERFGDRVAIIGQGSIVDVGQAMWALDDNVCDAVEMTRAQIADAELVNKVRRGEPERVRPCLLCNQSCQVRDNRNPLVSCVVDPRSGHETTDADERGETHLPQRVLVVGGGPAGLEAARVAASRGHTVTLAERSDALGGNVRTAAVASGRERLAVVADWLANEVGALGVHVEVGVDEAALAGMWHDADERIVAIGSVSGTPDWDRSDDAVVFTSAEVLASLDEFLSTVGSGPILIWDPIGGPIGVSVAETLVARGVPVHIMTQDQIIGNELARSGDLGPVNARLQQAGVNLHRRRVLRLVRRGSAEIEDRFTGARETIDIAALIDAGPRLPADGCGLVESAVPTSAGGESVTMVGDCVAPRTIYEAILEGRRAALSL